MPDVQVVVAVDDADTIELVGLVLFHMLGVTGTLATDGIEALEQVRQHKPSLVVLDLRLGKLSGLTVARRLKADPATKDVPIVALAGPEDARLDTVAAGFDDCILKPFDIDALAERLRPYVCPQES